MHIFIEYYIIELIKYNLIYLLLFSNYKIMSSKLPTHIQYRNATYYGIV